MKKYDHRVIEKKWQKFWVDKKFNQVNLKSPRKKFYGLVEFPYPSGEGLHVGHIRSYTAMDVIARKRRAEGYETLYPMGWDAFGLPTENYAIKTGQSPAAITRQNTNRYRKQLQALGFSFDWSREVNTSDPNYYKWTQWLFLQLFKARLAYKAKIPINWCPKDKIGLANEEVINGECERCGAKVEQREKEQWLLAITKYADRLDRDLALVDYPESIKIQQRNWIGRKTGVEVEFKILNPTPTLPEGEGEEQKTSPLGGSWEGFFGYHTTDPRTWRALHDRAVEMREKPTPAEEILWQLLRNNQLGSHFRRQHIIGKFIVDFVCLEKSLVVEVDGDIHDYRKEEDEKRTAFLEQNGFTVIRFQNKEIISNLESVRKRIIEKSKALPLGEGLGEVIKVFTTRPETIFGATFVACHGAVDRFTGEYVVNPANQEKIPVWEAEYVMAEVGTGAIMGVPAHDEHDREFAMKHNLPIKEVVVPNRIDEKNPPVEGKISIERQNVHAIVRNPKDNKYLILKWKKQPWITFPMGGVETGEDIVMATRREVAEETGYKNLKFVKILGGQIRAEYFAAHKNQNRVAYTNAVMFDLIDETKIEINKEEIESYDITWFSKEEIFYPKVAHAELNDWLERWDQEISVYADDGILINSGEFSGQNSKEVKEKIIAAVKGRKTTTCKLRDWVFSRQRYWGEPIPLIFCEKHKWVPVPDKDLPVKLPLVKKYVPTDTGESPLASIESWVKTKCPVCGGPACRETDTMPNWAGSSWYYLAYLMGLKVKSNKPKNIDRKNFQLSTPNFKQWLPVDWYNGGTEHTTLHLLYSRFWHKAFYDLKLTPTKEPYTKRTSQGLILAKDGEKMSKSRGNVVNPDEIVRRFGADTLRVYEMFMGPFDQAISWNEDGLIGARRFLERVWRLASQVAVRTKRKIKTNANLDNLLDQTIQKVSEDIESMKFNTAISALMILLNRLSGEKEVSHASVKIFLKLLSPFAPHFAEELWREVGENKSIHLAPWSTVSHRTKNKTIVKIVIQINGRTRDTFDASTGLTEEKIKNLALGREKIKPWLERKNIKRAVIVPNRLINIVTD